jgi:protein involved in polysaccharide export with SLBB domain
MKMITLRILLAAVALLMVANRASAQGSEYMLKSGDSIIVKISGVPPEDVAMVSTSYYISDNGTINLPFIGELRAVGFRPSTLQKNIEAAYRKAEIFSHPTIQVTPNKDDTTQMIFVSGEVKTPNRYPLSPGMTVSGAIIAAGGPTDFAKLKQVKLVRGKQSYQLDCREADSAGSLMAVLPGDTVVVPQ